MMRGAQAKMMTFQAVWNLLKQQKPQLFNFGNEDATVQLTPAKAVTAGASTIHAERPSDDGHSPGRLFLQHPHRRSRSFAVALMTLRDRAGSTPFGTLHRIPSQVP
jgi:hypothetical protein